MSITVERRTARPRGLDGETLSEAFQITVADNPDRVALRTKGDELSCTWAEYGERVRALAGGLAGMGLERGQTLALMLTNRPEFHFFDTAAMHLGATPYSIYNTYAAAEIEHQVRDADTTILVTERALLDRVLAVRDALDRPLEVVVVDGDGTDDTLTIADVEARTTAGFDFEATWRAADPEDLVTLIYTSGTTGPPKGVQLSHRNLVECIRSYDQVIRFSDGGRVVSYLPMAHIAERNVSQYMPMFCGNTVTCCPDPREVVGYLSEVRPSWFFGVPRIWEKLKAGLEAMLANLPDAEQRDRIQGALDAGMARVKLQQAGEEVPPDIEEAWKQADEQVLSNVRTMLGLDQLEACNVGAAPTPPEVIEFFHALGVPLSELWGMSETTAAGTCNPPGAIKIGTVGTPAPGVEVRLADDGEILVRGPVVMKGYRNQPQQTAEAIDAEGWMHTGDVGAFDDDGYLKIVDRKKELIIGAGGKNMSPANIESKVKAASGLIGQAVAIGDGRPYNVALITLDPDAAPVFAQANGIEDTSVAALAENAAVLAEIQRGVDAANEQLSRPEQIKCFKVLPAEWQPGGDELTPTMKLKRKPISAKYAGEIDALYNQS